LRWSRPEIDRHICDEFLRSKDCHCDLQFQKGPSAHPGCQVCACFRMWCIIAHSIHQWPPCEHQLCHCTHARLTMEGTPSFFVAQRPLQSLIRSWGVSVNLERLLAVLHWVLTEILHCRHHVRRSGLGAWRYKFVAANRHRISVQYRVKYKNFVRGASSNYSS
jgi:hypothetical protein